MRISDWSSDVCSSDLRDTVAEMLGLIAWPAISPNYTLSFLTGVGGAIMAISAVLQISRRQSGDTQEMRDARSEANGEQVRTLMQVFAVAGVLFALTLPFLPFPHHYGLDIWTLSVPTNR